MTCYLVGRVEIRDRERYGRYATAFLPVLKENRSKMPTVKTFVVMTDEAGMANVDLEDAVSFERLIAENSPDVEWGGFDENSAVLINQAKEPGRYADGNGLYLLVDKNGAKRWILRTFVHGRRTDVGAVHAGYMKRRGKLLRGGVRIYELKPVAAAAQP